QMGRWDMVLADLAPHLQHQPEDWEARHNSARALAHLGQLDRALEEYDEALKRAPQNGAIWLGKSLVHAQLGQPDQAAEAYARAVEYSGSIRLRADQRWEQRDRGPDNKSRETWQAVAADPAEAVTGGKADWALWRAHGLAQAALGQWAPATA